MLDGGSDVFVRSSVPNDSAEAAMNVPLLARAMHLALLSS